MNDNNQSSGATTTRPDYNKVLAEAARIRADLESQTIKPSIQREHPPVRSIPAPEPVIATCQVSIYKEGDRGSYAIQLLVGMTTVTTCVSLDWCCDVSLRTCAYEAAQNMIEHHLRLARASEQVNEVWGRPRKKSAKSKADSSGEQKVLRESSWVSKILPGGHPDFSPTAWNTTYSLSCSAAFAELAFHQID